MCGEERELFADIEKLMKRKVERKVVPGFEPGPAHDHSAEQGRSAAARLHEIEDLGRH